MKEAFEGCFFFIILLSVFCLAFLSRNSSQRSIRESVGIPLYSSRRCNVIKVCNIHGIQPLISQKILQSSMSIFYIAFTVNITY